MASREKEGQGSLRNEGDVKGQSHGKKKCPVCNERAQTAFPNEESVRSISTANTARFIVNMHYAFQDRENLYLVLDILTGGDLRYHIA